MCARKSFSAVIALLLLQCVTVCAHDYRQVFGDNYKQAVQTADNIRPLLQKYAREYGEDSRLMEAVIFPEIIRYNRLYDVVETGSLLGLYSRLGSDYADFSVGMLQMKPTFAESVERAAARYRKQQWVKGLGFNKLATIDNYDNRVARVKRIDDLDWQVKYLVAMLKCLKLKHAALWRTFTDEQKLAFAASAYNCGWDKPANVIRSYSVKAYYHLSPFNADVKYCFADVALYRYRELAV